VTQRRACDIKEEDWQLVRHLAEQQPLHDMFQSPQRWISLSATASGTCGKFEDAKCNSPGCMQCQRPPICFLLSRAQPDAHACPLATCTPQCTVSSHEVECTGKEGNASRCSQRSCNGLHRFIWKMLLTCFTCCGACTLAVAHAGKGLTQALQHTATGA
jgi:hypothetical protein